MFIIRDSPTYEKKPWKAPDLPVKYSRMLFLPQNDSLLKNILPVIEHSVKNKENVKFPGHCWKYGRAYLTPGYFFFHWCVKKWGSGDFCDYLIEGWCIVSFEAFKYFVYFIRVSDYCNYSQFMAAFWTYQRVHLIDFFKSALLCLVDNCSIWTSK